MAEHPDVTLIKRGYEAFSKGDLSTLREIIAEDAVHSVPGTSEIAGDHKGIDAILAMYGKLAEMTGGAFSVTPDHFLTDGKGTVVSVHRDHAERGGKTLDGRAALVFRIEHGQVVSILETVDDIEAQDAFWV